MAFTTQPKLFLSDLSNYAAIRRGLPKSVRDSTPTKTELMKVEAGVRENYLKALNEWRMAPQSTKKATSSLQKGAMQALLTAASSKYLNPGKGEKGAAKKISAAQATQKIQLQTAALKLKGWKKSVASMKIRELMNARGRLRNQDFYKAQWWYNKGEWNPSLASDDILKAFIEGGGLIDEPDAVIKKTFDEYAKRFGGEAAQDQTNAFASYFEDMLKIASLL